jgi:hypothetical protein
MPTQSLGDAFVCPFEHYVKTKADMELKRGKVKIIEEIKTLFIGQVEKPDPQLIGKTIPVQTLMIAYACVYKKDVPEETKKLEVL